MRTHGTTTSTSDDGFRRVEVITGVGRRRRWTGEEKAWIVAESLDPASTVSAVARRYGLHPYKHARFRTREQARAAVFNYVEIFYNRLRRPCYRVVIADA